jgi:hypothetical protein
MRYSRGPDIPLECTVQKHEDKIWIGFEAPDPHESGRWFFECSTICPSVITFGDDSEEMYSRRRLSSAHSRECVYDSD